MMAMGAEGTPWRPARLFFLVVALLLLTAFSGNPFFGAEMLARAGDQHYAAGEFTFALRVYGQARADLGWRADFSMRLGQANEALHRWDDAREAYAAASRARWTEARALAGLTRIALAEGDTYSAARLWERAAHYAGSDAEVVAGYAHFLWQQGEFAKARDVVARWLHLSPSDAEARYRMGVLALLEGNAAEAETHLQITAQGPGGARSTAAAMLEALHGGYEPDSVEFYLRIGVALLGLGEYRPARLLFQKAREQTPDSPVAGAYYAYCLALAGDEAGAMGILRDVAHSSPDYPLVWYFLGELERRAGRPAEAKSRYLRLLKLDPENSAACVALGDISASEGALAEAEAWHQKAVKFSPDDGQFALALARFYVDRLVSVRDKGTTVAKKAAELLPGDPAAHDVLGWAYFLSGDLASAKHALEAAVRLDGRSAAARYHLGSVYYAWGNRENAIYHLTRAVDAGPDGRYAALARDLLRNMRANPE